MDEESMETGDAPSQGDSNLPPDARYPFSSPVPPTSCPAVPLPDLVPTFATKELREDTLYVSPHSQQVSLAQYNIQSHHCTQQALRDLKASPEYKKHTMKCHR